jgi:serine/threonine protein kinase
MPSCVRCKREVAADAQFCSFCGARAGQSGSSPSDPWIGRTIAQKYLIHELIDRGGMGLVYKATDLALDRPVAVKMLDREMTADPTLVARFHREARAASRLNHPNSVTVIDFGQADDGTLFMALEFLPGRNLARVIANEFPVGTARVVKIGSQVLAALTEAHALGIVHCDIKPENVMLETRRDEKDAVKVLDFGIAKLRDIKGPRLTVKGLVCGTPGYSSPEQARGEELDPRSDLYSVGVLLYELLSGKLPFEASSPGALVAKMLVEPPVPLHVRRPDILVPADLEAVVMKALSPDRESRFTSADEFRQALLTCGAPGERTAPLARAQGTVTFDTPPAARTPTPPRTAATSRPASGRTAAVAAATRPTTSPRRTVSGRRPASRAAREAASVVTVLTGSALGALLLGTLVWYGLSWLRASRDAEPARVEATMTK